MGDQQYEKEYLERKERLRTLHQKLKETKDVQEIYHKIMGSTPSETEGENSNSDDDLLK